MMSFLLLYLLSQTIFVQSQLLYSDAEVTEVIGYKRSIEGEREFHIKFGNESVDLDLVSSDGLLPKTLSVNVLDVDDDGNLVIDDWVHTTNGGKEIYVDFKHSASLLIEENNGRPELKGKLNEKLYIQPNKEDNSRKGRHSIYQLKPKATLETRSNDDVESVPISENQSDSQSGSSHEKRQQLSQIYVPLHIVVDFDLYSLIGYNPANVIEYVKTFVGAINAYFALIQQPRVQISIQAIDIYKSKAAASTIEQHRNYADNGLICGEVLKTYRKWANTERSRIGDNYAAIFILTGSKSMCDQPQNNQCNSIRGLAYAGAACEAIGKILPGETFKVGIAGDDYSYNGVQDATHEVGHLLGMSHDGSPGPYQNAPSAVACRWGDFNLMGQPTYVKARTRWSTCSVNQLQYWAWYSGKATCVRYPPSSNPYPLSSTKLRVYDVQRQCQVRHGSQATFPSFCQKLDKVNDEMCYKLMCYDSATGQCKYGFGAAPGTPCDPTGQYICYQGACQNKANIPGISNTGNSGSSNTGNSGNSGNQGNSGSSSSNGNQCVDTPGMTFGSGNNCAQYLSNSANSYACDWQIIRQHCCQSRRTYCGSNNNPQGCVDNPTVNIGGLNCGWYLYRHASQSTCNWDYVKQQCCAARLTYCSSHIIG